MVTINMGNVNSFNIEKWQEISTSFIKNDQGFLMTEVTPMHIINIHVVWNMQHIFVGAYSLRVSFALRKLHTKSQFQTNFALIPNFKLLVNKILKIKWDLQLGM